MKKQFVILISAALMVVTAMTAFASEKKTEEFLFQDTCNWGMTQAEVREVMNAPEYDAEQGKNLVYIEPEDDRFNYEYEGIPADIKFGFKDDKLVVIFLSFDLEDKGVTEQGILDAFTKVYNEGEVVTDLTIVDDLMAFADKDEIEMADSAKDTYTQWTLDNGTIILLQKEADGDDIHAAFFEAASLK